MFFLTPRYLKEAKHYRHALRRLIHYKEDILKSADLATLRELLAKLEAAMKRRNRTELASVREEIDTATNRIVPPPPDAGWRENVEVILVAIVIAAGVRAFFLQPFKIPTGSMQPTLYGIVGERTNDPAPNLLVRAFQLVVLGRHYVDVIAKKDDVITDLKENTYLNFFTFTTIIGRDSRYTVFAPRDTLMAFLGVRPGVRMEAGKPIARGHIDTGDQVFVDKMSYHFVPPTRGDVFVFKTVGIPSIQQSLPPGTDSQHYIKRLAGVPGDVLRIAQPRLFIGGQPPTEWVFQRVMSLKDGYNGYSNTVPPLLTNPQDTVEVREKSYFALGDNSFHSKDSRAFGSVPQQDVAGRALFVYWPFSKRWGLIR
jgi:signal peptidase I